MGVEGGLVWIKESRGVEVVEVLVVVMVVWIF